MIARSIFFSLLLVAASGCRDKQGATANATLDPIAAKTLVQHLVDAKRSTSSANVGDETVWTDSAIIERTKSLPPALDAHLRAAPQGAPTRETMTGLLARLEREQSEYRAAKVMRSGNQCSIEGNGTSAAVSCVYVDYLEARYPKQEVLIRGQYDPVLVREGSAVRAALMPMKR